MTTLTNVTTKKRIISGQRTGEKAIFYGVRRIDGSLMVNSIGLPVVYTDRLQAAERVLRMKDVREAGFKIVKFVEVDD